MCCLWSSIPNSRFRRIWQSQLRYYWENTPNSPAMKDWGGRRNLGEQNMIVRMVQCNYPYGYEYLGASARLVVTPLTEFFRRQGAWLVLLFVLLHKIGDTLANLTLRLLLDDLGFSNEEIATYDVGFGFIAYLVGIFIGGVLYARLGMKRSVLLSLVLMAVSNLSFAALAAIGHSNGFLAFTICFENVASGIGGVVVVAYLSALCNLAFTATQFALLSAAASVVGRFLTGTTAGGMIESMGYVQFYLLTFLIALPGVFLYGWLWKRGLVEQSIAEADIRKQA